jgi:hypothetical protein
MWRFLTFGANAACEVLPRLLYPKLTWVRMIDCKAPSASASIAPHHA